MSFVQPRGCLLHAQDEAGAEESAVLFAEGYGTARCGMDRMSCICNCKNRRVPSEDMEPEPEHVALLTAATLVFVGIVFICGNASPRVLRGSWPMVAFSMI